MQLLVVFLIATALIGASPRAAWVREHQVVLVAFCTVVAVGFYSFRVVL